MNRIGDVFTDLVYKLKMWGQGQVKKGKNKNT